jgi:hypothetical protein
MGIHIAMTLPDTLVDIMAATTPVETIQLHITAADEQRQHAGGAVGGVAHRAALADVADLLARRRWAPR